MSNADTNNDNLLIKFIVYNRFYMYYNYNFYVQCYTTRSILLYISYIS